MDILCNIGTFESYSCMRNIQNKNNNKRKCIIIDFNFVWLSIKSRAVLRISRLFVWFGKNWKSASVQFRDSRENILHKCILPVCFVFRRCRLALFFLFMCGGLSGAIYNSCWMEHKKNMLVVNCKKHTIGLILKWIEVYLFSLWLAVN